jgi:hypothetical protein
MLVFYVDVKTWSFSLREEYGPECSRIGSWRTFLNMRGGK